MTRWTRPPSARPRIPASAARPPRPPRPSRQGSSSRGSGSSRRWSCCSSAAADLAAADAVRASHPATASIEPPVTSPRDLPEAYAVLAGGSREAPVRPIAGGTDLMVTITGELAPPPASVVDLWAVDALRGIAIDGDALVLGALTTYTDVRRSALCREHVPALVEAAGTIGAAQIQNRGTLGGNIANASPA